jgi:uncharacterized membrane protein YecN with MAPEG domain
MTHLQAATLWVGLHVLLMLYLKIRVGATRNRTKVNFGGGDSDEMKRAMRVQGNAVEDVPVALLGLIMLALIAAPLWLIHASGGVLLVSRMMHAFGLGRTGGISIGRVGGTLGTVIATLAVAIGCIYFAFQ